MGLQSRVVNTFADFDSLMNVSSFLGLVRGNNAQRQLIRYRNLGDSSIREIMMSARIVTDYHDRHIKNNSSGLS